MTVPDHVQVGDIVAVYWQDALWAGPGYWQDLTDAREHRPAKAESVGYVVALAPEALTLTQSVHKGHCGGVFAIPTDWVQRVDVLRKAPPKPTPEAP